MKRKITIMKKQEISDEEIRLYMDFDRLMIQHRDVKNRVRNDRVAKIMFGSAMVMVGLVAALWWTKEQESLITSSNDNRQRKTSPVISQHADSIAEKKADTSVEEEQTAGSLQTTIDKKTSRVIPQTTKPLAKPAEESTKTSDTNEQTNVAQPVYIQAEPVEGYPVLYNYFSSELRYPETMMKDSVQGVVMVVFTITAKGAPDKITIDQSLGKAFDDEAIRLIKNMPAWKPATYNNKPVASRISLPITFQITKLKSEQQ